MISLRRKILFYTFILIFIIATPLVLLYSSGYKISYNYRDILNASLIQKTGMIILETDPKGALVIVNDKIQQPFLKNLFKKNKEIIETPTKIKGLLPGEYIVQLQLENHWDWTKKIKIEPGKILLMNDIKLFKKTLPLHIFKSEVSDTVMSPNKKIIFLPLSGQLFDVTRELHAKISSSTDEHAAWSKDSSKILIEKNIFQINNGSLSDIGKIDLKILLDNQIENIKWSTQNSNTIYFSDESSINELSLDKKNKNILIKNEKAMDYLVVDNHLFYITARDNKTILKTHSLSEQRIIKEIELPFSDSYQLLSEKNNILSLYDKQYQKLYLVEPFSLINPLKNTVHNIKLLEWLDDDQIVYANDFEISTLNLNTGEIELLTRISDKINKIITTNNKRYIIYSTNHGINVLERDERSRLLTTELINLNNFSTPWLDEDESTLYFSAQIGSQTGLYKLDF